MKFLVLLLMLLAWICALACVCACEREREIVSEWVCFLSESVCVFPCDVLGVVIDALGVDMRAGVCVCV